MTLALHQLSGAPRSRHRIKRVGRGNASGHGTFSTRGSKGQRARAGGRRGLKRLGAKRIIASLPKRRGFTSRVVKPFAVNVGALQVHFPAGAAVTVESLKKSGLVPPGTARVKLIGGGKFTIAITVRGIATTAGARSQIESAGGTIIK